MHSLSTHLEAILASLLIHTMAITLAWPIIAQEPSMRLLKDTAESLFIVSATAVIVFCAGIALAACIKGWLWALCVIN